MISSPALRKSLVLSSSSMYACFRFICWTNWPFVKSGTKISDTMDRKHIRGLFDWKAIPEKYCHANWMTRAIDLIANVKCRDQKYTAVELSIVLLQLVYPFVSIKKIN